MAGVNKQLTTVTIVSNLFLGTLFFTLLYVIFIKVLKWLFHTRLSYGDIYHIAMRLVSLVQAIIAGCIGLVIVYSCKDPIKDRHYLTDFYVIFGVPYFYYDAWAMYISYYHNLKMKSQHRKFSWGSWKDFLGSHPLMMAHHIILPVIYFPIITYFRRGLGDFFVGCFFLIEFAVPFISIRGIILQLGMKESLLYKVNGIIMIIVFGICRVFIFPFMYSTYGAHIGVTWWQVPAYIPIKCNVSCAFLLLLQLYWWFQMIAVAVKTIKKSMYENKII